MVTQPINNIRATKKRGIKGCRYRKDKRAWDSWITINGKRIYLGYFKTEDEARESYRKRFMETYNEEPW